MLKMVSSGVLFCLTLWTVAVIGSTHACPDLCVCSDQDEHHLAQCTFKDLTETPVDLPRNVTILNLSNNRLSVVAVGSFDRVTTVTSLWIAQNAIVSVERGSLAPLIHLHNFDVSQNLLVDFPWEDLRALTALQMLKMNHNQMATLPRDAFTTLRHLESLRLNNNRFATVAQGTFAGLTSISHLQLYNNPFTCDCSVDWLRDWILTHTVSVPKQSLIVCDSPQQYKGVLLVQMPPSECTSPGVIVTAEPDVDHSNEDTSLILTCEYSGNPEPAIVWRIRSRRQRETILMTSRDDNDADSAESTENSPVSRKTFKVYGNGTLVIFHISAKDSGNYSCTATNALGTAQDTVVVEVVTLPKPSPTKKGIGTYFFTKNHQVVTVTSVSSAPSPPPPPPPGERPDTPNDTPSPPSPPPAPPPPDTNPQADKRRASLHDSKCGLTSKTKYISNHGFNGSLEDTKEYTFDFGVIALSVSETEARVRLNPLLVARGRGNTGEEGLYLCLSADPENPAMQWSGIQAGVNTYVFSDLRPATNYSLCFTYTGRDCDVQVVFSTRREAANLLIIVSVCMVLLTVSTVPLLVATCYHLVLKYRGKTYKLILKARDQYQVERNLGGHFHLHAPYSSESRRNINGSEMEEEAVAAGGRRGGRGGRGGREERGEEEDEDDEGSQVTESFSMSRAHTGDCEASSEYSDRLPLGAEAVNITSDYRYPSP